jgi:winged helix-turn-helix protein DUF2582
MNIASEVGDTAGKVWHVLNDAGPHTLSQLKKVLSGKNGKVEMALGWLAREDKIEILQDKKNLQIRLK